MMLKEINNTNKININILLIMLIFLLAVIQVFFANRLITSGEKLNIIETQINNLEKENHLLETQIAYSASIDKLKKEATRLGFTSSLPIVSINQQKDIALRY